MKISIYTIVRDGIYFDYHLVQMLKHHLPFADEIVVNEGYSSDNTYDIIKKLDPKIKIFRTEWDIMEGRTLYAKCKEEARKKCTGDWCILMDCDEFIPEWDFDNIRSYLNQTEKKIIPMRYIHFYGNYKVYNMHPEKFGWVVFKQSIHRNFDEMEVWGDGSNVKLRDSKNELSPSDKYFECHHFGFVRSPARLRHKWRIQHKLLHPKNPKWDRTPGFLFDLRPHNWYDKDFIDHLEIYDGPFVRAVREEPTEFVRDDFLLYEMLLNNNSRGFR